MAVLPRSRRVKSNRVRVADLASESFILFHREGYPGLFDTTLTVCQKAGFNPRVENQPNNLQTVLSLVEAEQGVSIVPACARNLRSNGLRFYRLNQMMFGSSLSPHGKRRTRRLSFAILWS